MNWQEDFENYQFNVGEMGSFRLVWDEDEGSYSLVSAPSYKSPGNPNPPARVAQSNRLNNANRLEALQNQVEEILRQQGIDPNAILSDQVERAKVIIING